MKDQRVLLTVILGAVLAAGVLFGAQRLLATTAATPNTPPAMSFQGYVTDAAGVPLTGTVSLQFAIYSAAVPTAGETPQWSETHPSAPVANGYFAVMLGQGSPPAPLTPAVFDGPQRYIQVTVNGGPPLPRQMLASVPYAFQAYNAVKADEATTATTAMTATYASAAGQAATAASAATATTATTATTAVTATYATTATTALNVVDGGYANVIVVAKSGGDFTSVAAALNSIASPSETNRYLVYVAPGVYSETALVEVKGYVHLQGAGSNATAIESTRSGVSRSPDAATAEIKEHGLISNLTVRNKATSNIAIGIYSGANAENTTRIDNVYVEVTQTGGSEHHALYLNNAETIVQNNHLRADGAATNAALGGQDSVAPLSRATVEGSYLKGGGNAPVIGQAGYGVLIQDQRVQIRNSYVRGSSVTIQTSNVDLPAASPISNVEGSRLEGYQKMVDALAGTAVKIATTQFIGTGTFGGTVNCIYTYDVNFAAKTCP